MKLRMLVSLAGPQINLVPGDIHTFDAAEGARLCEAGFAVPVTDDTEVADAAAAPETATKRRGKRA